MSDDTTRGPDPELPTTPAPDAPEAPAAATGEVPPPPAYEAPAAPPSYEAPAAPPTYEAPAASPYGAPPAPPAYDAPAYGAPPAPPAYGAPAPAYGAPPAPPAYGAPSAQGYPQAPSSYAAPAYGAPASYGQQAYVPYPTGPKTNVLAILSLIASIVGFIWLLPFVGSLAGAIMGHLSLNQLKKSGEKGRGMALAGVIVGWVGLAFFIVLGLILLFDWLGVIGSLATSTRYGA